jgi:hypothetical protein
VRDSACFVIRRSGASLPAGAATAAPKASTATKTTEATTTTAAKTTTAATPSATPTAEAAGRDDDRNAPGTASFPTAPTTQPAENAEYQEEDEEEYPWRNPGPSVATAWIIVARRRCWRRCERCVQLKVELLCEPLRRSESYELQSCAIVPLHEGRRCFAADVARVGIGDESFRATTRGYEAMSASVLARLLGNEKDHRACVAGGIAGIPYLADLPLPSDLERNFLNVARADVSERDDRHLAARFRAHILGDALHALDCIGLKHVREIVHQPGRRRDLDALEKKREPGCSQDGNESRRRRKPDQNRSKYLLSLDFMVWQEVYLADDSHPS